MLKLLQKLFGNKQDKDAKELRPYVTKILAEYVKLRNISDDELRGRSDIFRQRIQNHIKEVSAEIAAKKKQAETTEDLVASERMYEEAEKLRKKRNEQVEQVLMEILPEAFA
ncbi:MAG: preprotein translocase subunit SecA, partial [Bacteroidia bacterium]|nr:preprotein translocase subunit SecA [Bacteroidia bacterium]